MDYIRAFEVELDKTVYYSGEIVSGHVYLEVEDNMRMQNIKVLLRGKAHTEWKITRAGERRTMKQDETYIDEKIIVWGKEEDDSHNGVPILTRGRHHYPFHFQLPDSVIPCSFESKIGTIRYYVRVNINIPYASCPQSIRYFTVVGPNIDCMDDRFLIPVQATAKRNSCSLCCGKGPMLLRASLDRTSYVSGEQIKLKAEVQNGSDSEVWVMCKLVQYVEFFINKGVLGLSKEVRHTVLEVDSDKVPAHDTSRLDELMSRLVVPVMPPTMIEDCALVQIYYTLKLCLETSKGKGETTEINFPITIGTVPFRPQSGSPTEIHYETAAPNVEGGMYISTEFQLGQVYMGDESDAETDQTILYRPVYVCVNRDRTSSRSDTHLLQVPPRQCTRSRENLKGSREALQTQENVSPSHALPTEGAKGGKPQVEDKFLQEITSKIANRQVGGLNDDESKMGMGKQTTNQVDIDSQVELMRKQKQSNDFVHKALVSELRRHLSSEGEETNGQGPKPPLKKVTCLKKVSESSIRTDQGKRLKTETRTEEETTVVTGTNMETGVSYVKEMEKSISQLQESDVEIEASELTALLSDPGIQDIAMKPDDQAGDTIISESVAFVDTTMQEPEDTSSFPMASTSEHLSGASQIRDLPTIDDGTSVDAPYPIQRSVDSQIAEGQPLNIAVQGEESLPEPKPCSPKVAPKPKQKDRHSFPTSQLTHTDSAGLSAQDVRPKSEYVETSSKLYTTDSNV